MRALWIAFAVLSVPVLSLVACSDDEEDDTSGAGAAGAASSASSSSAGGGDEGGMGGGTGATGGEAAGGSATGGAGGDGVGGGAGGAGGGAGGGGGGGYDGVACLMCINPLVPPTGMQCADEYAACQGTADCLAWLDCINDCWQPNAQAGCWDGCDAAHPDSAELYGDFYDCVCGDCEAVCGSACM